VTRLIERHGGWRRTPEHLLPELSDQTGLGVADEVDPRGQLPPVFDQGQLGSCTSNAVAAALQYDTILDGHDVGPLSRLWIYYQERKLENQLGQGDTGAYGVDAFRAASTVGLCKETDWPYDIQTFQTPPPAASTDEGYYKLTKPFQAVTPSVDAFKAVLSNRQTIAFGFDVYQSFESPEVARTGVMPVPDTSKESLLGGHEVLLVGYLKSDPDHGLCRNSWSASWGQAGYFSFPWSYLTNAQHCGDWQTIVRPAG